GGEGKRRYWLVLGFDLGLLLLPPLAGLILPGLLAVFPLSTTQGRAALANREPWLGGMIAVLIVFPHLMWIDRTGGASAEPLLNASALLVAAGHLAGWLKLIGWLVAFHAGALVLLAVAGGVRPGRPGMAPGFQRAPGPAFAEKIIFKFAVAPPLVGSLLFVLLDKATPIGGTGALVILSALGVIVAAGDVILLYRQSILGRAWLALLLLPPATVIGSAILLPWTLGI